MNGIPIDGLPKLYVDKFNFRINCIEVSKISDALLNEELKTIRFLSK